MQLRSLPTEPLGPSGELQLCPTGSEVFLRLARAVLLSVCTVFQMRGSNGFIQAQHLSQPRLCLQSDCLQAPLGIV